MNQRIKELLCQAYDQAVPETWTTLSSEQLEFERWLEKELTKIKIEIKIDGKWTEVKAHMLVDDPDDFKIEWLANNI